MERFVCIHGHFYQPPRENPWLESVELQHSAYPYHDWNERITAECYTPNAFSRILDTEDRIVDIVNNYRKISFDFGPTLLNWLELNSPATFQAILEADQASRSLFGGHGNALAQPYNHLIMPLANRRDKYTQVIWGIRYFESKFARLPEGLWLPETAVDLETLEVLADAGIKFTILAAHQANRIRRLNSQSWEEVKNGTIDTTRAYQVQLASGRRLAIFFYDGPVSRAIAFEGLLSSGENLVKRLSASFSDQTDRPQLVNLATDGESYGHHHPFGDMALAYALYYLETHQVARLTNYAQFLEMYPPQYQVEIVENTSWSCTHGIERWRADCGCRSGNPPWNQKWRGPLRAALDWLRDRVAPDFQTRAGAFLKDPWQAREAYIQLIMDRSPAQREQFWREQALRELDVPERVTVLKLLEIQRHAMLMYTSCGWFFDDISGLESVQVIQYAGRVAQLAGELFGDDIEEPFMKLLQSARSNLVEHGDGRRIYAKWILPARIDLSKVAAHFAVSSLFEDYPQKTRLFCYEVEVEDQQVFTCGKTRGLAGRVKLRSEITLEAAAITFGVIQFNDHVINAGVRLYQGSQQFEEMLSELTGACSTGDFPEAVRLLDKHFGDSTYSLKSLFKDEQNRILSRILESTLNETEAVYRRIYQNHYPLMRFLRDLDNPLPVSLISSAEIIINADLKRELSLNFPDSETVTRLIEEAGIWQVRLDNAGLALIYQHTLENKTGELAAHPRDPELLDEMEILVELAGKLPFPVDIRNVQNTFFDLLKTIRQQTQVEAGPAPPGWERFLTLGQRLLIRV